MLSKIKALLGDREKFMELVRYFFTGVATTLVNWIAYALIVKVASIEVSNALAWVIGVVFAFVTNKLFVFGSRSWALRTWLKEAAIFFAARIATGILEIVAVPGLVNLGLDQRIFGIEGMVSKVIVTIIVLILNYVFSKLLVFKNKSKED